MHAFGRNPMDHYLWIRVVSDDWEYTERLGDEIA